MAGLRILIPSAGPGTGPVIPPPLHDIGAEGVAHRWIADRLDGASGSVVEEWPDLVGDGHLTVSGTASETPTLQEDDGIGRYVRLPVTAEGYLYLSNSADVNTGSGKPATLAAVIRVDKDDAGTGTRNAIFDFGDTQLARATNDSWQFSTAGGTPTYFSAGKGVMADFALIIATVTTGAPWGEGAVIVSRDGTEYAAPTGASMGAAGVTGDFRLRSSTNLDSEFVEVARWDRALDATERASVRAAMKAQYPFLP